MCIHTLDNKGSDHCSVPNRTPVQAAEDRKSAKDFYWGVDPSVKSPFTWDPPVPQRETHFIPQFPSDLQGTAFVAVPTMPSYNIWLPCNNKHLSEQDFLPVRYFYTPTHMLPNYEYAEVEHDQKNEDNLSELALSVVRFLDL